MMESGVRAAARSATGPGTVVREEPAEEPEDLTEELDELAEAAHELPSLPHRTSWRMVRVGLLFMIAAETVEMIGIVLLYCALDIDSLETLVRPRVGLSHDSPWIDFFLLAHLIAVVLQLIGQILVLAVPRNSELLGRAAAMFVTLAAAHGLFLLSTFVLVATRPSAFANAGWPAPETLVLGLMLFGAAYILLIVNWVVSVVFLMGIGVFFLNRKLMRGGRTLLIAFMAAMLIGMILAIHTVAALNGPDKELMARFMTLAAGAVGLLALSLLIVIWFTLLLMTAQLTIARELRRSAPRRR